MKDLHLNLLEKTAQSAGLMGDIRSRDKFGGILMKERESLDAILNNKDISQATTTKRSFWSKLKGLFFLN